MIERILCAECSSRPASALPTGDDCSEHPLCAPCRLKHRCTALTIDQKLAKWRAGVGGWKVARDA